MTISAFITALDFFSFQDVHALLVLLIRFMSDLLHTEGKRSRLTIAIKCLEHAQQGSSEARIKQNTFAGVNKSVSTLLT
jgi:hypothetical protein